MLESLRRHTPADAYELILSDDASDASTREFLADLEDTRVVASESNRGFAAACNAGAQAATGEVLAFLNSDLELRPGWLEALRGALVEGVGAVGAKLLYPDGTIQHGGVFLREDRLDRVPLVASHDRVGEPGDDPEANRRQSLLAVTAAAFLVRRDAFESLDGFDEGFFNGYEDVDLCLKLRRAGWKIVYEPACELVHHESKSGAGRFAQSKANQRRFLERWAGVVRPEVLVDEFLTVGPHPDCDPENPFYGSRRRSEGARVRILVPSDGQTAALAATLESIFAARIGLEDRVVALTGSGSDDDRRYLVLCSGHDDALTVAETAEDALFDGDEEFVVWIEPGTIVTQGWLSRMILQAGTGIEAVGPVMTGVTGPQDALSYVASGSAGHVHPNELTHLFARSMPGRSAAVSRLESACLLMPREAAHRALLASANLTNGRIALDVFVHRDLRLAESRVPAAA